MPPTGGGHWFEAVADHAGSAYLRYAFTKGTAQEVAFLVDALDLSPGSRVLDVGCGPGRHAHDLASRGVEVVGVDISARFVALAAASAPPGSRFARGDARTLPFRAGAFDAVVSLCQGGFGLLGAGGDDGDELAVAEMARVLRSGGALLVSAFSAYFQVRHLGEGDGFDAAAGVNHELAEVRDEGGRPATFDLWTSVFTPRELRLLAKLAGLVPEHVWAVRPGEYAQRPPDIEHEEHVMVARKPGGSMTGR